MIRPRAAALVRRICRNRDTSASSRKVCSGFRKRSCSMNNLERDDVSKIKSSRAGRQNEGHQGPQPLRGLMSRKYFGTDGIRGRANGVITPELALKVGQAVGLIFKSGDHRHRVLIGKDTRLSGYMIETALVAGFTSVGMDVLLTGPIPTPAVAMLTRSMRAALGVMISASHNRFDDNGIKLFGPDGYKLSDAIEADIENLIDSDLAKKLAKSADLGRARRIDGVHDRYIEFAKRTLPRAMSLDGLRIVVDCAHGAAYRVAP